MSQLPDIKSDFAQWYQEVIARAELVDSGPVRGTMVIRPYGYAIWERIQSILDAKIKELGAENAYFPLLIPEHFMKKEAEHVEGFSPELAVVTHVGGKELEEPLVVRPTSETIIYHMFSQWIKSWRDLPLKINQWANVVRWEMRPRAFLRTTEFLWQEGHTAHATPEEAVEMMLQVHRLYNEFAEHILAIPVIAGEKSESERFAGAQYTYTTEGMMQDGKALQMCTSHLLNRKFSDAFGILFQDKDNQMRSPYCTSWGATTRLIGALIMVHGDQQGLILPPRIAPITTVIVPIFKKESNRAELLVMAEKIKNQIEQVGFSVLIDDGEQMSPGAKFCKWELKGVPIRIELGQRELEKKQIVLVNRVEQEMQTKRQVLPVDGVVAAVKALADKIQKQLFERAKAFREKHSHRTDDLAEFGPVMEHSNGFYRTGWCGQLDCEIQLKKYKGTIRCVLTEKQQAHCAVCGKQSVTDVIIAKAY